MYEEQLKLAQSALELAAERLLAIRTSNDSDQIQAADLISEKIILEQLQQDSSAPRTSKSAFLSEESEYDADPLLKQWIIDPLDGTTNYRNGKDEWGVMIAFSEQGELKLGLIYLPKKDTLITAVAGAGVRINGHRIAIPSPTVLSEIKVDYDTFAERRKALAEFHLSRYQTAVKEAKQSLCSAEAFRRLILGETQVSLEYLATPWDDAAGVLAVRELGGAATDFNGQPWSPQMSVSSPESGIIQDHQKEYWSLRTDTLITTLDQNLHQQFLTYFSEGVIRND